MNQILIKHDSAYHPPKIVIQDGLETLIDMPLDEFIGWIRANLGIEKAAAAFLERAPKGRHGDENNEGDRPCEDGLKSDSLPGTGC